jgi:hypothetical protein
MGKALPSQRLNCLTIAPEIGFPHSGQRSPRRPRRSYPQPRQNPARSGLGERHHKKALKEARMALTGKSGT